MVAVYTFGVGGYTGGCILVLGPSSIYGSSANTGNLAGNVRRHSGYLGFGTVSSLKSGIQNSVCSAPPKILQILSGQQLYCDKESFFSRVNNLNWWEGGISDRTKVYKILYSATEHWKPEFKSILLFIFGDTLCSQAAVHQLNCPRLGAMDGGRDAGGFLLNC